MSDDLRPAASIQDTGNRWLRPFPLSALEPQGLGCCSSQLTSIAQIGRRAIGTEAFRLPVLSPPPAHTQSPLASCSWRMFRILSGRQVPSHRSTKSMDMGLYDFERRSRMLDLARTVEDDDDSPLILYSDVEEDVRDFELHARQLPDQSILDPRDRKKKRHQSHQRKRTSATNSNNKVNRTATGRRVEPGENLAPMRAIELRPPLFTREDSPDLDGIIRAFARKRDSARKQLKRRGMPRHRPRDGCYNEEASSSSYQSGFSSSESSSSERGQRTSLLAPKKPNGLEGSRSPTCTPQLDAEILQDGQDDRNFGVLFARYGITNSNRKPRNDATSSSGTPVPKPCEHDTMSSADESDARSRRSFSSIVSYTRSLAGSSMKKIWRRKKRPQNVSSHMDQTEGTTESVSCTPPEEDFAPSAQSSVLPLTAIRLENGGLESSSQKSVENGTTPPGPHLSSRIRSRPTTPTIRSSPLATGSMRIEVRGFDCDTGGFATESNLARSNVLKPNTGAPQSAVVLTRRFDRSNTAKVSPKSSNALADVRYIVNPADMQRFLKSPAFKEKESAGGCERFSDGDDISSLSSNSSLTLSSTSVVDKPNSRSGKVVGVRAKSLMSSKAHSGRYLGLNESSELGLEVSRPLKNEATFSQSLKSLQHQGAASPQTPYLFPPTLQLHTSNQSLSVLLIDPVLKVFEIVSVGVSADTTVRGVIRSACVAAADDVLSRQSYVSLCVADYVISNLDDSAHIVLPSKPRSAFNKRGSTSDESMRREMEHSLIVAVPESSSAAECIKIRRILWKNPKLQVWWQSMQRHRSPRSLTSPLRSR
jgi:hypothetical protein